MENWRAFQKFFVQLTRKKLKRSNAIKCAEQISVHVTKTQENDFQERDGWKIENSSVFTWN